MEIHNSGIEEQVAKFLPSQNPEDKKDNFDPENCDWADDKV